MPHPLVVSYYTPGTAYERKAARLAADLARLHLRARIEPLSSRGSWVENCAMKADFIRQAWRDENGPVLWMDADARMRRRVPVFETLDADLAVVRVGGWSFYTGQILFGGGTGAGRLLDAWCRYCATAPQIWDQVSLGYAWWDLTLEAGLRTAWLDERVFERRSRKLIGVAAQAILRRAPILQTQESRRSKARQGASARPEFASDDLPEWWREAARRGKPFPLDAARRRELGLDGR